jgi:hypothetical protein
MRSLTLLTACFSAAILGACAQNQSAVSSPSVADSAPVNGSREYYSNHDRSGTPERAYYEDGQEPD